MTAAIDHLLNDLIMAASSVRFEYGDLFHLEASAFPIPIPFFGAIESAKVVTIGLNPSDGEFRNRHWPTSISPQALRTRLTEYFSNRVVPPHPWFRTWSEALTLIGVSYSSGSAAHIDICPWAAKPMSALPDQGRFTHFLEESVPSFTRCLRVAAKTRLILFAGAVNNRVYLNEFIGSMNREGLRLDGEPKRQGPGFVCVHTLHVDGRAIPAFFCSVSPSSRTKGLLPARVAEHQDLLRSLLGGQSSSNNPLRPMRACGPRC